MILKGESSLRPHDCPLRTNAVDNASGPVHRQVCFVNAIASVHVPASARAEGTSRSRADSPFTLCERGRC